MIVKRVDSTRECFNDYNITDGILTIGGIAIDVRVEQAEQEVIITFCRCGGMVHRGMSAGGAYVAEVVIPPRKYDLVEAEVVSSAGYGEEGKLQAERVVVPLDLDTVSVTLWPIEAEVENEQEGVK
jgi:hypothetical protein